jgi:hypothetical protein
MIFANRPRRSRRGDEPVGDEGDNEDEELDVEVAGVAEGERLGLLSFLENVLEERVVAGETGSEADSGWAGAGVDTVALGSSAFEEVASTTAAATTGIVESSTTISSTISSTNVAGASMICVEN